MEFHSELLPQFYSLIFASFILLLNVSYKIPVSEQIAILYLPGIKSSIVNLKSIEIVSPTFNCDTLSGSPMFFLTSILPFFIKAI